MKLFLLALPLVSALRLPSAPKLGAAAAISAAPLPALALYEPIHQLAPGTEYGDVVMGYNNLLSASVGLVGTVGAYTTSPRPMFRRIHNRTTHSVRPLPNRTIHGALSPSNLPAR